MVDHTSIRIDGTLMPNSDPCPDCGRSYLIAENITVACLAPEGGTRTVWSGCVDCWVIRSHPDKFERLREFAEWVVSLDDDDPDSPGRVERRTVTLTEIVRRAHEALVQGFTTVEQDGQ